MHIRIIGSVFVFLAALTGCGPDVASARIGTAGGRLALTSGVEVVVPKGSIEREGVVTLRVSDLGRQGREIEIESNDARLVGPMTMVVRRERGVRHDLTRVEHEAEFELAERRDDRGDEVEVEHFGRYRIHNEAENEMETESERQGLRGRGGADDVRAGAVNDDGAGHNAGDDNGQTADDPANHDVGDDNGQTADDPANHNIGDDNGVDDPATHDLADDNGGSGANDDSAGEDLGTPPASGGLTCASDDTCACGSECVSGQCTVVVACASDADCSGGSRCRDARKRGNACGIRVCHF